MGGRPCTCTDPELIIAELDARSRTRALNDWESRMLERAIKAKDRGTKAWGWTRELARLGVKRSGAKVQACGTNEHTS